MITVREAAEAIVSIQGRGSVDHIEQIIQKQLNIWRTEITVLIDGWTGLINYNQRKARRRRHIVNALNRTKERV